MSRLDWKLAVRIAGFALLALLALNNFYAWTPDNDSGGAVDSTEFDSATYSELLSAAAADNEVNADNTDSAPQQQVANGWYTNDLLNTMTLHNIEALDTITANQTAQVDLASDSGHRIATLLLLGVLAVVWHGATLSFAPTRRERGAAFTVTNLPPPPPNVAGRPSPPAP